MSSAGLEAHVVVERRDFALDATLHVADGAVLAVMGPSGAGKSTLLRVLAGLERPTRGRIRIDGRIVDDGAAHVAPMHRGIVLLGQDPRLFPHLTAAQNVAFALQARGVRRVEARSIAAGWLDRVGLGAAADRRPAALSGGQQQRVALARALAAQPRAVLLDEPLTSLDPETAAEIRSVVAAQLTATSTTAVLVTHDAIDAVALADTLAILDGGRIVQQGEVRTVLAEPATRFTASIAGVNRVVGGMRDGVWTCDDGVVVLRPNVATRAGAASVAVFPPSAVTVLPISHAQRRRNDADDDGTDRWRARVVRLEATLGGVRVVTATRADGQAIAAEVAVGRAAELGLAPGAEVEVGVTRALVRLLDA